MLEREQIMQLAEWTAERESCPKQSLRCLALQEESYPIVKIETRLRLSLTCNLVPRAAEEEQGGSVAPEWQWNANKE